MDVEVIDIDDDVVTLSPPPSKKAKPNEAGLLEQPPPPVTLSIDKVVKAAKGNVTKVELEKVSRLLLYCFT